MGPTLLMGQVRKQGWIYPHILLSKCPSERILDTPRHPKSVCLLQSVLQPKLKVILCSVFPPLLIYCPSLRFGVQGSLLILCPALPRSTAGTATHRELLQELLLLLVLLLLFLLLLFLLLFFLLLFLLLLFLLLFLLQAAPCQQLLPLPDDQLPVVLITGVLPRGLAIFKVEEIDVTTRDSLAARPKQQEKVKKHVKNTAAQATTSLLTV